MFRRGAEKREEREQRRDADGNPARLRTASRAGRVRGGARSRARRRKVGDDPATEARRPRSRHGFLRGVGSARTSGYRARSPRARSPRSRVTGHARRSTRTRFARPARTHATRSRAPPAPALAPPPPGLGPSAPAPLLHPRRAPLLCLPSPRPLRAPACSRVSVRRPQHPRRHPHPRSPPKRLHRRAKRAERRRHRPRRLRG